MAAIAHETEATTPVGVTTLVRAAEEFKRVVAAFDPALVASRECATAIEALVAVENACSGVRALAAARAAAGGAYRERGFADAGDWLASLAGTTTTDAKRALDLASRLDECPETRDALIAGEVSLGQAAEIAATEKECPGSEGDLLRLARTKSLGTLRDEGRRRRAAAVDPRGLHEKQRRARRFRHWRNELGMVCLTGELPPEVGVPFVNRLDAETDRVRRDTRKANASGPDEAREAYAADAFVRMTAGGGKGTPSGTDLVIVCDLAAWRRGETVDGERCHIVGGGSIPVALAHELGRDAFLKAVLVDGVEIKKVLHIGRYRKAELQTALDLGPGPVFEGTVCTEVGCDRRYGLEHDHVDPVANGGLTSLDNLVSRCRPHHREKTERDRLAGLLRKKSPEPEPP
ncbi:MAG TPA: DUF222 domain-containing protein [Acidimicrobiales bacterium]|jgi:hypothetical protein|nr:DUF222 domain-containing protein [Acidimicrobiales bacterium]